MITESDDQAARSFEATSTHQISFVIPTRNRPQMLDAALTRMQEMVRDEDELIIVEGQSTEETDAVVEKHADLIDTIVCEPDTNATHAFNKGMMLARGSLIKIVPDDDTIFREPIDRAIALFDEHREVDVIVCGGIRRLGGVERYFYVPPGVDYGRRPCDPLVYGGSGVGLLVRRSALPITGLFDTSFVPSDAEFLCRAIARGAVVKFARLDMFYHEMYEHSAGVAMRDRMKKDAEVLWRLYCPERMRWQNRLRLALGRNSFTGVPARALRNLVRGRPTPKTPGLHQPVDGAAGQPAPVWDGGFS